MQQARKFTHAVWDFSVGLSTAVKYINDGYNIEKMALEIAKAKGWDDYGISKVVNGEIFGGPLKVLNRWDEDVPSAEEQAEVD